MSGYHDAFACIDIDALSVEHLNQLERAQALYLDKLVDGDVLNDGIEEFFQESLGILLRNGMFLSQRFGKLGKGYLVSHNTLIS